MLQTLYPEAICISAKTGFGLKQLAGVVLSRYKGTEVLLKVCSSHTNGKVRSFLYGYGTVLNEEYSEDGVVIDARLGRRQLTELERLKPKSIEIISG
jgi:GTP-binding protein HflX